MGEQSEVDRLLKEIRELNGIEEPAPLDRGVVRFELVAYSAYVERDEQGFMSRIVSPEATHTVIRDENHRVVRLDTEKELLSGE